MSRRGLPPKNFTRNIRVNTGVNRNERKELQIEGFKTAMLSGAAVLNDIFDFEDDEIKTFCEKLIEVMGSIGEDREDCKRMNKELERMTGINIMALRK